MRWILVLALVGCGGGHGTAANACHGLSLADCRFAAGCAPDTCAGCGCDVQYRGCLGADEIPATCPALGCPTYICCSSELTCAAAAGACTPPGTTLGCGACNTDPGNCTTDADCTAHGASMVCDPIACSCGGNKACAQGCVDDTTCGEGEQCEVSSARCVARVCADDAGCPANFRCPAHACVRLTCASDLDCDGYCVDGTCYAQRGRCEQPVP